MPQELLWVHKDAQSKCLSQSERLEEAMIRRHVQQPGRPHATSKRRTSGSSRKPTARRKDADLLEEVADQALSVSRSISPTTIVLTPAETRSFGYFMRCDYWAGWRDAHLWQKLVVQMAQSSTPVMHGLLALSTFHENSLKSPRPSTIGPKYTHLTQIGKAVSSAQRLRGDTNLLQHLMTCTILCCALQLDRPREAVGFLRAANLMLQQCASQLPAYEIEIVETWLRPVIGLLCNSFCRPLEAGSALMLSVQRHRSLTAIGNIQIPTVPTSFDNLGEAAHLLGRIHKWAHDTVPVNRQPGVWAPFRELHRAWLEALDNTSVCTLQRESMTSRQLLRLSSMYGLVLIETFNSTDVTGYDMYNTQFTDMLDLAAEVCVLPNACAWMFAERLDSISGVDNGLIGILSFIGAKSRSSIIRQRVLELLYFSCRFEGNRLACSTADELKMMWQLPIQNLDDVQIRHYFDQNRRKVCVRGMRETSDGLKMIRWSLSSPVMAASHSTLQSTDESLATRHQYEVGDQDDDADVPDMIYGIDFVEFLDDVATRTYTRLEASLNAFPIFI